MVFRLAASLLVLLTINGCQQYDVSFNERVVYSPRPLLDDFTVDDPGLRRCLERAINDRKISSVGELQRLECQGAGIRDITGLGRFSSLSHVDLSDNAISGVEELGVMLELRTLILENNRIEDATRLYNLPVLAVLNLRGNPGLRCPAPEQLQQLEKVTLPRHCQ
ncbi:hypothetical protein [Kineobactrum sediminis]|nr:hypothetical protein [Kineobactrum sediminis]